jgi:Multicopper oxidase
MLGGFQEVEFDFVADNPGPTLFHCHQKRPRPSATGYDTSAVNGGIDIGLIIGET